MATVFSLRRVFSGFLAALIICSGVARADDFKIEKAEWKAEDHRLAVVGKGRDGRTITIANAGSGTEIGTTRVRDDDWRFRDYNPDSVPCRVRVTQEGGASRERDVEHSPSDCDTGTGGGGGGGGTGGGSADTVSINSTSQNSADVIPGVLPADLGPVPEQAAGGSGYQVVAINDLGMHCGDFDTRISSILPPFQVLLAQVIRKGGEPDLMGPDMVDVYYSAASNPNDPVLEAPQSFPGRLASGPNQGHVYKTNFWDVIPQGAYDPFYPGADPFTGNTLTPLAGAPFTVTADEGLPVPNVEDLYIGHDGIVNNGDEFLSAVQHDMPGIGSPYLGNEPRKAEEHYGDKPFFINFPFGYVANDVNWFEGGGIAFSAYDDFGRENAYPLVRVQAKAKNGDLLATVDTVLPISGEASCKNCHGDPVDVPDSTTKGVATARLSDAGLPVEDSTVDPELGATVPLDVSVEYATDINVLRLHDLKHGADYVAPDGSAAPCAIDAASPDGDANCLINQALVQNKPVVCQVCHYTPALDLAQLGPLAGGPGTLANGRNQVAHQSNSRVMHDHHGKLMHSGSKLFPDMPAPVQDANGVITNQAARVAVLEQTCYQCHPGSKVRCLRGAMFNGGMLCNDCHGDMEQVGNDFTAGVSPANPGDFQLGLGNFYDHTSAQPRVPWANEPGCGSCHTGDALNNALTDGSLTAGSGNGQVMVNVKDLVGNVDGLRLRRAYRNGDPKATPIVPSNKRFAEDAVPADYNGFANPGAGNPKLYRVSIGGENLAGGGQSGHGGIFCEGCHGATHAEWPNGNPLANDNVTANQMQGHTGVIIECSTCHTGDLGNTLGGPHGMHPVGDVRFVNGGHEDMAERNLEACAACHGANGEGTVLSVAKTTRTGLEEVGTIAKGTPVGCGLCHENPLRGRSAAITQSSGGSVALSSGSYSGETRNRERYRRERD